MGIKAHSHCSYIAEVHAVVIKTNNTHALLPICKRATLLPDKHAGLPT